MVTTKLAFLSLLLATVCSAEDFDIVTRTTLQPGVEQIRIDRPNPTKRSVDYPQITFQPDDGVTISAGGCVQSGGHGSTWHRYVDPSGGDSDKLYHGLITIPFATGSLERIQKYQNRQVHVAPTAPPGNLHLQLGFEDDDYSDNGYGSHDDGPNDQCKGATGGPAWVVLTVAHKNGSGAGTSGTRDWDLNLTTFDDNGIPLNPDWHHHFPSPDTCRWPWNDPSNQPDCVSTGQITNKDEHYTCELRYHWSDHGLGGHANWTPATYTGSVTWDLHSNSVYDDDDYAVNIQTPGAAIATAGRNDGVHVEFDSEDTVDVLTDDFKLPHGRRSTRRSTTGTARRTISSTGRILSSPACWALTSSILRARSLIQHGRSRGTPTAISQTTRGPFSCVAGATRAIAAATSTTSRTLETNTRSGSSGRPALRPESSRAAPHSSPIPTRVRPRFRSCRMKRCC